MPARYLVALLATAAALLLRLALHPVLDETSPFLLFAVAIMVSAAYGGFGPGLLSTVAGALAADLFIFQRKGFSRTPDDLTLMLYFVLVGVQISWLSHALHKARRSAEEDARAARESEQRYRTLASHFPNGAVFLFDRDLRLVLADGSALSLATSALPGEDLRGRTLRQVIPEDAAAAIEPVFQAALAGSTPVREVSVGGRVFLVHALPLRDGAGQITQGMAIAQDLTDRVRAREALQKAHDELDHRVRERTAELQFQKTLLESQSEASPDGILVVSDDARVLYHNQRFGDLWRVHAPPSTPLDDLVGVLRRRMEAAENPLPEVELGDLTHDLRLSDGRILEAHSAPIVADAGRSYGQVWFFRDVTDRKRLERQVLEVCEREQRRIGQDLHDGLGQHLTGVSLMSKGLEQRLSDKGVNECRDAALIATLVEQAIGQARALARGLRPVALEADALPTALAELASLAEKLTGVPCAFSGDVEIDVDDVAATHLYRIAQEATNNAVKHAQASQLNIRLEPLDDGGLTLSVEDDGVGLPASLPSGTGMGLQIMQYRARMIGATVEVRPRPAGGTIVTCTMPGLPQQRRSHDDDSRNADNHERHAEVEGVHR